MRILTLVKPHLVAQVPRRMLSSASNKNPLSESSSKVVGVWNAYNHQLVANPIMTKCITAGALAFVADIVCQVCYPSDPELKDKAPLERIRWKRSLNFLFLNSIVVPPVMHYWYGMLSTRIVGTSFLAAVKRVFFDQALFAPVIIPVFLGGTLLLDGAGFDKIKEKLRADWLDTLLANYSVWIPAQLINFSMIPIPLRVLWANFVGFFWSIYLSNAANSAVAKVETVEIPGKPTKDL